jgi:hypothetical protein
LYLDQPRFLEELEKLCSGILTQCLGTVEELVTQASSQPANRDFNARISEILLATLSRILNLADFAANVKLATLSAQTFKLLKKWLPTSSSPNDLYLHRWLQNSLRSLEYKIADPSRKHNTALHGSFLESAFRLSDAELAVKLDIVQRERRLEVLQVLLTRIKSMDG